MRLVSTEDGDYTEQIDETVKKMLETSLIAAVMKFDPCKN
ncbi:helix-turn-helix domain-containing protein [Anaerotignum lactatifermentans]